MASLISCANGNFTAAGTWALVNATSLLDSEVGSTEVATAPAWGSSQTFVPGAITIDGIAVKLASRTGSPTGTVSVRLYDTTLGAAVAGATVTINTSDLPTCTTAENEGGWILFKFAAPVLLLVGDSYRVEAQESVATDDVLLWRNATASNWSRMLRTTTTQAPAAGDILHVMGEHTGPGTGSAYTVTMDSVAATDYGTGVDGSTALTVCKWGTLNYGFAAATNYYLKLSGNAIIYNGGIFTIGSLAGYIPRNSTAVLEFDPVADGGMGLLARNMSAVYMQGLSRTVGKNVVSCKLNTDEAIGQTVLGVDTDTGWLAGDEIGIASTTRTYSQCERRTLSINASATELTVTAGLTYAHSGTSPTQAEVILLTRNVKVRSATSTVMAYVYAAPFSFVDMDWAEFYYIGENATNKYGITIATTAGNFDMRYCSVHDTEDCGIYLSSTSGSNISITYNVAYNMSTASANQALLVTATTGVPVIDHNIIMLVPYGTTVFGVYLSDVGLTLTNNTVVGSRGYGISLYQSALVGNLTGNTVHSCGGQGVVISYTLAPGSTLSNLTVWRCNSYGLLSGTSAYLRGIAFDSLTLFGNASYNIYLYLTFSCTFTNLVVNSDPSFSTDYGIGFAYSSAAVKCENCLLGTTTPHAIADIGVGTDAYVAVILHNCLLASGTEVAGMSGATPGSYILSQKHDQVAGLHRGWVPYGAAAGAYDVDSNAAPVTDHFRTAAPSLKMSPGSATLKLESAPPDMGKKAALNNGATCTFSAWVRKSAAACGHAGEVDYNGNQPRLVLKKNVGAGIPADVVLAVMTVGLNVWEQLSGVTPAVTDDAVLECIVDCDGTAGFINCDDWAVI